MLPGRKHIIGKDRSRTVKAFLSLAAALVLRMSEPVSLAADSRGVEILDPDSRRVVLYEKSYALVIGVSDYTGGWSDLPEVNDDVEAVAKVLEDHGFELTRKINPDHQELRSAIHDFISQRGQSENDRLLVYFSGHGHTIRHTHGDDTGFIVPADAPEPDRDRPGFMTTALPLPEIEVWARLIQAKHALFVFDSCFSGSLFSTPRAAPEHISYKTAQPVRQFITSGSADELVPERSIFRRQFVAALEGTGDTDRDGYITGTELGEYLMKQVVHYSRQAQHPQYGKIRDPNLDKGDFVFKLPATLGSEPRPPLPPAQPFEVAIKKEYGHVYDQKGNLLWAQRLLGSIVKAQVADLDGDANNEVIFCLQRDAESGDRTEDIGKIMTFDSKGTLLWSCDTTGTFNYPGGSHKMGINEFKIADLFRQGRKQIVTLSVDSLGWYHSRLCIIDSDGKLLSSYWHPGHLHFLAIDSQSEKHPPRIIVAGVNNDLRSHFGATDSIPVVFMLDPQNVEGEAPPYLGRFGRGSHLWYGFLQPEDQQIHRITVLERNGADRVISVWTRKSHVLYLDFNGKWIGRANADKAEGTVRWGLVTTSRP